MISDTLSDAIMAIQGYQRDIPQIYAALEDGLNALVAIMHHAREYLDAPPDPKRAFITPDYLRDIADELESSALGRGGKFLEGY